MSETKHNDDDDDEGNKGEFSALCVFNQRDFCGVNASSGSVLLKLREEGVGVFHLFPVCTKKIVRVSDNTCKSQK